MKKKVLPFLLCLALLSVSGCTDEKTASCICYCDELAHQVEKEMYELCGQVNIAACFASLSGMVFETTRLDCYRNNCGVMQ